MRKVERLQQVVAIAKDRGFEVRYEWLGGSGGGCAFGGKKWLFIDLALSVVEQLDQVTQALEAGNAQGSGPSEAMVNNAPVNNAPVNERAA